MDAVLLGHENSFLHLLLAIPMSKSHPNDIGSMVE